MHHYICIIISAILDILIRIIFGESIIEHIIGEYFFYLLKISYILFISLELVLYKYYMFIKYIKSYEILFFEGLFLSVLLVITLIILIKIGYIQNFWDYYENIELKEIILFVSLILIKFICNIFQLIIIDYFSPFHILLTNKIPERIAFLFIYINKTKTKIFIFDSIIILIYVFVILIFVELIELNFLGLSKMTKRNIELRAENEYMEYDINNIMIDDNITLDDYKFELGNEQITNEDKVSND